ncbi:pyridoxal-phosphate dependent enzyme [Pseudactinotalea sp.]|uniref:pyridoxal-phosphate dependent enzyme n=1 Tax=Pseudactinotalea sp. TaxID=1926260 RepID=UPI003B3B0C71
MPASNADAYEGAWEERAARTLAPRSSDRASTGAIAWPGSFTSGSRIYLIDESRHPTSSLKHDTMRLVLHRLIRERRLGPGRPVVVASARNAAVAAAYWCRLLELPCTVVVPASTAAAKIELIRAEAADVVPHAPPAGIYDEARRISQVTGGFYLDHFTQGPAAATEPSWQLAHQVVGAVEAATGEPPTTVVAGLGSGATAAGFHAYRQREQLTYRIVGVDAENSAYLPGWLYGVKDYGTGMPSRVEGIGRPMLPESFDQDSVDLIAQAPDAASIAGARRLRSLVNAPVGASSGACLWAAIRHARRATSPEVVVALIADAHAHYLTTCHSDAWCRRKNLDPVEFADHFEVSSPHSTEL